MKKIMEFINYRINIEEFLYAKILLLILLFSGVANSTQAQQPWHPQWAYGMPGSDNFNPTQGLLEPAGFSVYDQNITAVIKMWTGKINFDPEGGEDGEIDTSQEANATRNLFMLRYALDGSFLWKKRITTFGVEGAIDIFDTHTDSNDNGDIFVFNAFEGNIQVAPEEDSGDIESPINSVTNNRIKSAYLAKYNQQGNLEWVTVVADNLAEVISFRSRGINVAPDGSIYVAIAFNKDIFIRQGGDAILLEGRSGDDETFSDVALIKLNPEGDVEWFKSLAGDNVTLVGNTIELETDAQNNVYLASGFNGTLELNPDEPGSNTFTTDSPGQPGVYWVKFSPDGDYLAGDAYKRASSGNIFKRSFHVTANGNLFLGIFSRPLYILSEDQIFEPPISTSEYLQILKYNSDGEFQSVTYNIASTHRYSSGTENGLTLVGKHYTSIGGEPVNFNPNGDTPITFDELDGEYFFLTHLDEDVNVLSIHPLFKIDGNLSPFYSLLTDDDNLIILGRAFDGTTLYPGISPTDGVFFEDRGFMIGLYTEQETVNTDNGVSEYNDFGKPFLYPNPVVNHVNVAFPSSVESIAMEVFNAAGQLIFAAKGHPDQLINRLNSKLPEMERGFYILRITDGMQLNYTLKMIKK